jgi:uncharacterized protein (TIGR02453 family)
MAHAGYFTQDGLAFLRELAQHNEKAWFEANKQRFEDGVRAPALRLVADIAPVLRKVSKHMVADPRPNGGSVSRIYRDTRFSKDKSPYKTALFLRFGHDRGAEEAMPGLYLHVEPGASTMGGGIWHPAPAMQESIRKAIVASPARWTKAKGGAAVGPGCAMGGEVLKRVPKGYDPAHQHAEDLKRKDFGLHQPVADAALVGKDLLGEIERGFLAAKPLLEFLCRAVDLPF